MFNYEYTDKVDHAILKIKRDPIAKRQYLIDILKRDKQSSCLDMIYTDGLVDVVLAAITGQKLSNEFVDVFIDNALDSLDDELCDLVGFELLYEKGAA